MSVVLAECRYQSIGQVAVKYRRVSADMRVSQQSTNTSTESRPTHWSTVGGRIDRECVD